MTHTPHTHIFLCRRKWNKTKTCCNELKEEEEEPHTHTHTLMMQKQKRRATFPRATGAFLFWKVGGVFFFFLFAFQPPHQKEVPRFFWGGPPLHQRPHRTPHVHTYRVCLCPLGFFFFRDYAGTTTTDEPAVAVPRTKRERQLIWRRRRNAIFGSFSRNGYSRFSFPEWNLALKRNWTASDLVVVV